VLTNATLITDEIADRFAQAGVIEVSVSVYGGSAEVHDRVTEMPGSFERTMAGIARLKARGIHVIAKTPLLAENGAMARDLHRLATAQNIPCSFDFAITPKNNGDPGPLALALERKTMVGLMTDPELSAELVPNDGNGPGPEPCNAGRGYCAIGPTGDLLPCIAMPVVVGNLRRQRFADLWKSDPFLERLRALTAVDLHACGSCEVKGSCTRCPGIAMQRGQDITGCDLSAKQVAKARVEARAKLRVIQ
jgi:radical SAM protein with 4Fe4S-binding SPASM domain